MSIASRITAIEEHIGNIYDTLELGGADLTNVNKNILNIDAQLKDRYLDYLNNGTDEIWNNWEKVIASDVNAATLNNTVEAPMKIDLKGNTSQEENPSPENPQTIHNVSGNNNIKIENKNLFNKDNVDYIKGYFNTAGYIISYNTNTLIYIPIKDNTTVYIKKFIGSSNIEIGTSVKIPEIGDRINYRYSPGALEGIYNVREGEKYLVVFVQGTGDLNAGYSVQDIYNNLQIEYNSIASSYIAHQEQNLPFTFETGQKAMQGTTLQDDGIHQKRKQIDLGSLSWTFKNTNSTTGISTYTATLSDRKKASNIIMLSSHYVYLGTVAGISPMYSEGSGISAYYNQTQPNASNIYLNSTISTSADLITFLQNNNAKLEYELATEEVIPYSTTQQAQYNAIKQAKSYNQQTNISQTNDDLPFILDITALKNI